MNMCAAFAELGHEVSLICRRPKARALAAENIFRAYDLPETFQIIRYPFSRPRGRKTRWALRAATRARLSACDLAYGRSVRACLFAAHMGIPVIHEAHKPFDTGNEREYHAALRLLSHRNLRRLVVLSTALERKFRNRYGLDSSRVKVVYNAARDPANVEPMQLTGADSGRDHDEVTTFRVGYAGSLHTGKGMELIVELAPKCPWAHFYVAGGDTASLASWNQKLEGAANLTLLGSLRQETLPAFRAAMDVLLVPPKNTVRVAGGGSIEQADAPPLKLFEALASGKPVLCSDFLYEVVNDGQQALLCNPETPHQWLQALEYLYTNEPERAKLSRNARSLFLSEHTWTKRASKVLHGAV